MASDLLNTRKREELNSILEDLKLLAEKSIIKQDELDNLLSLLKSNEAKLYIKSLCAGSKPETALRESFLARESPLAEFLFGELYPETKVGWDERSGFVDYTIIDKSTGRTIRLELKALFEAKFEEGVKTKVPKELKQVSLEPNRYKEQIQKYLREEGAQYVILTNLKEWYFYSKMSYPEVKPFAKLSLNEFLQRYELIGNIFEFAVRLEGEVVKEGLDERFFEDLKKWVNKLSQVEFETDDKTKLELIVNLINKFIFIQTLDDYGVIGFNWIRNTWRRVEELWKIKGEVEVVKRFLSEVDEWFYSYYDTELFKSNIFNYVKNTPENIKKLYDAFKTVLGVLETPVIPMRGIIHYNFRHIDEDVLGKAYETFLAEARKEKGIYYTPKYITQYIVENTVGKVFDELLIEIDSKFKAGKIDEAVESIYKFTSIKVLDPACGSGSFLIKAFRAIVERYRKLGQVIDEAIKKSGGWKSLDPRQQEQVRKLENLKKLLGLGSDVELFSKVILRHIYGVDLDERALEVAKVNIWLESIKLSPKAFRYDRLRNVEHVLPNLELNLRNGDSLVGFTDEAEFIVRLLSDKYKLDLVTITTLRHKYLENPARTEYIDKIRQTIESIKKMLYEEFKEYVAQKKISEDLFKSTKPLHWIIDFWHVFFDEKGEPLPKEQRGFDVIIGNPPYVEYRNIVRNLGQDYAKYLKTTYKCTTEGQFDITIPFTERAIKLLRKNGLLSFIMTNKFMITEYGYLLRKYLLESQLLEELIDVSNIKVFKDAGSYPVVFRVRRIDDNIQYNVRIASVPPKFELLEKCLKDVTFSEIPKKVFISALPMYIITPYLTGEVLKIFEKINGRSLPEDIIKCGVAQSGFSDRIKTASEIDDKSKYIMFVQGEDIVPYYVIPSDKYYPVSLLSTEKLSDFKQKKVMIPGLVKELYCGYDETGMGCGRVYYITEKESPFPLLYLVALFNSSLFKFIYRIIYGMSHLGGDYLRVNAPYLTIFKIKDIDENTAEKLNEIVSSIIIRKKARYKLLKTWNEWCKKLSNLNLSLSRILSEDLRLMQEGKYSKTWTSNASFYPMTQKLPDSATKKYEGFRVYGDPRNNVIRIYGLDEEGNEELIYEVEFVNRELMLHVYCSLVDALESKAKIESLKDLLEKTMVPVIKGGRSLGELTPNIIRRVVEDFKKWLESEKIQDVSPDIVVIDNEIENLIAQVDAHVFKLYGLSENEVKIVLNSLKKPVSYLEKVLEHYRKI